MKTWPISTRVNRPDNDDRSILEPVDRPPLGDRWLSTLDPDPRDLLVPYPAGPMRIWSISTRVNKPENDDPSLLEPVDEPLERIAKES
jgi:putative SOS response-associated peptidase YedK